ncbi:MAG: MBL fold metallo-hydrolase [Aeromicrobium sp.]|uniref:MBL fold metallo-hydrolase n=1 Tax=Aeromicrobium sp. TaxID=1871063 RepID=UPI0039E63716
MIRRVSADVFCVEGTAVNWTIVREGRELTLIDAGYPGDEQAVVASIRALGHEPQDVRAVLVTHAHVDHLGAVGHLHATYGTPVYAHADELPNLVGERHESATRADVLSRVWRPRVLRWSLSVLPKGVSDHVVVPHARDQAEIAGPDGRLDLPGRPLPVHLPGHTSGSCAYLLPEPGVLASGDALITGHPLSTFEGPQLLPDFFSHDPSAAERALDVVATLAAETVVPGHGRPWRGDAAAAAVAARQTLGRRLA